MDAVVGAVVDSVDGSVSVIPGFDVISAFHAGSIVRWNCLLVWRVICRSRWMVGRQCRVFRSWSGGILVVGCVGSVCAGWVRRWSLLGT